jgi:hypothetical protein
MARKHDKLIFYKKVRDVQAVFQRELKDGMTNTYVFKTFIQQQFYIKSERQFYRYLNYKPLFLRQEIDRLEALETAEKNR